MRFFFYGTLMDEDVRRAVLGVRSLAPTERATLEGWRRVKMAGDVFTLGMLVQTNYGGRLTVCGRAYETPSAHDRDGSIVIVIATDAPLSARNLKRLAERAFGGLARTGAALSNGSGDYALAFSTAPAVRERGGDLQFAHQGAHDAWLQRRERQTEHR